MRKFKHYFSVVCGDYCIRSFIIVVLLIGCLDVECLRSEELKSQDVSSESNSYVYVTVGRSDPFKPFVAPKVNVGPVSDPNEIIEDNVNLDGMQLFEPGQLTLVGTMLSSKQELALVEDQTKKGYVIKTGTLIGKRGVVSKIGAEEVVVTETAKTRSGQEIKSTVMMKLNKEGDR
jgi:type IV pilus assembly protein PilP